MSALALGGFRSIPTNPLEDPVLKMLAAKKEQSKTADERIRDRVRKEMEHIKRFPLAVPTAGALAIKISR